ncbi:hydroxypyruvate isomerase family protein [Lacisediminihabitans profunda]|uniref:hydroxypyruvate isomerase family protein n=1 Tax=Lacisediminihabitans profunda TaxID=2594790 RepID=UPI001FE993DE|nr:TIM barrel protein [Lacisediminihabitans profunda]
MPAGEFDLVANVSLLFTELPLLDRFSAAASAGFHSVELWWPFADAVPIAADLVRLTSAISKSGIALRGMNLWAGDMAGGERGVVSLPDRRDQFEANVAVVAEIARATGCRVFNALYGQRQPGLSKELQEATAVTNLALAARELGRVGGTVLLEPLSRGLNGDYPIQTVSDAIPLIQRARETAGLKTIALLFDTFHLSNNEDDLVAAIHLAGDFIGHVQVADAPGRGAPGTGAINFRAVFDALVEIGYSGAVSCEYLPNGQTEQSLGWIAEMNRPGFTLNA